MTAALAPGQILTVFRSRLLPDANPAYGEHAARMSELAEQMPGYVDHKTFTAEDGERVTIATFADRASQEAWRLQVDHAAAQRAGIAAYYETYSLQVAAVDKVSTFTRATDGQSDR
ncbi:MAG TPA: antibiotic biosynthesis monooxygenase [Mycobacteriales bacterium]|nr:antibiotic biosynthesis monooxygenase [Mycobacteriales bacterium]